MKLSELKDIPSSALSKEELEIRILKNLKNINEVIDVAHDRISNEGRNKQNLRKDTLKV